jgi:23S rRNA (guanosine2251-2'-O)-methyltransferase
MTRKHNDRFRGRDELTVYGRRAVVEALAAETVDVLAVAAARDLPAGFRAELAEACAARGVEVERRSADEINRLSGDARQDQGVAARIRLTLVEDASRFIERFRAAPAGGARLVALDGVTNPQNVGMIVRSAVASGMDGMLWPAQGSPWVSGLIIKASAASVYRCRIVKAGALADGLAALQAAGMRLCGLVMRGGAPIHSWRPPTRAVFIVGHETEGLSGTVEAMLDERISIPMHGGIESLNAAVAASILCFRAAGESAPDEARSAPRGGAARSGSS